MPSAESLQRPSLLARLGEVRAAAEPIRLLVASPSLASRRTDTPRTAVVIPGLGAGDRSTSPLRSFLTRVGHRATGWGLGRHGPDVEATLERFVPRVVDVAARYGEPVALVGWSLGGVVARETARVLNEDSPGSVDRVVTFGSPVEGPRHTSASRFYSDADLDRIDEFVAQRRGRSIGCDVLAIHSRNDGVVGWRTCVDHDTPGVVNLEVSSTHLGMGIDPDVWSAVADALDGRWPGPTLP